MIDYGGLDNRVLIEPTAEDAPTPTAQDPTDGYSLRSSRLPVPVQIKYDDGTETGFEKPEQGLFIAGHGSPEIIPEGLALFWLSAASWDIDLTISRGSVSESLITTLFRNEQQTLPDGAGSDFSEPLSTFQEAYRVDRDEDLAGGIFEESPRVKTWNSKARLSVSDGEGDDYTSAGIRIGMSLAAGIIFFGYPITYWPDDDEWQIENFIFNGEVEIAGEWKVGFGIVFGSPTVATTLELRPGVEVRFSRGSSEIEISGTMKEAAGLTLT